jgi:hypothetical protein
MDGFYRFVDEQRRGVTEIYEEKPIYVDEIKKRKTPLWERIISCILLVALGLSFIYLFLLHPVTKIKLKMFLVRNYTIEIRVGEGAWSESVWVKLDGNIMKISSTSSKIETAYYEFDGKTVYQYVSDFGDTWTKQLYSMDALFSEEYNLGKEILKRRNYRRVKGHFLLWEIKDDVDIGDLSTILSGYNGGRASLFLGSKLVVLTVKDIGRTKIDIPWEK